MGLGSWAGSNKRTASSHQPCSYRGGAGRLYDDGGGVACDIVPVLAQKVLVIMPLWLRELDYALLIRYSMVE
ncbi:hypothetical protein EJB05_42504, partial [Eragrostis curvula]